MCSPNFKVTLWKSPLFHLATIWILFYDVQEPYGNVCSPTFCSRLFLYPVPWGKSYKFQSNPLEITSQFTLRKIFAEFALLPGILSFIVGLEIYVHRGVRIKTGIAHFRSDILIVTMPIYTSINTSIHL